MVKRVSLMLGLVASYALGLPTKPAIKIGYVNGLTGPFAGTVIKSLRAVQISVNKINARGGIRGQRIELLTFETSADPLKIPSVMEKALASGVRAVVGFHMSNDALIAADIAEKYALPMVVAGATHPGITAGRRFVVRVCWNDDDQGTFSARFAKTRLHARRIAIIRDVADSYTLYLAQSFRNNAETLGLQVVADHPIRTGDRNFGEIIAAIRAARQKPDVLYMPTSSVEAGYFIHQMHEAKMSIPLLGCDSWQNADFYKTLSALGSLAFNAYFVGHWHKELPYRRSREFVRAYEARFHEELTTLDGDSALAYDAAEFLFAALEKEPSAKGRRLAELLRATSLDGATGSIRIRPSGDPIKPVIPLVFSHGKVTPWND